MNSKKFRNLVAAVQDRYELERLLAHVKYGDLEALKRILEIAPRLNDPAVYEEILKLSNPQMREMLFDTLVPKLKSRTEQEYNTAHNALLHIYLPVGYAKRVETISALPGWGVPIGMLKLVITTRPNTTIPFMFLEGYSSLQSQENQLFLRRLLYFSYPIDLSFDSSVTNIVRSLTSNITKNEERAKSRIITRDIVPYVGTEQSYKFLADLWETITKIAKLFTITM